MNLKSVTLRRDTWKNREQLLRLDGDKQRQERGKQGEKSSVGECCPERVKSIVILS